MKRTAIIASFLAATTFGSAALAGSVADPAVDPAIIVDDATSSSSGALLVVALAYLILVPVLE